MMFRSLAAAMLLTTGAFAAAPATRPQPSDPTAPAAVETTTVSPGCGRPTSSRAK